MSCNDSLPKTRQKLIQQIDLIGTMRKGSVTEQMLPYKKKDGSVARRGPYFTYTFKEGAKTKGRHLRDQEEAQLYQGQIERYRTFQDLARRLVETSQAMADAEADGRRCKKNSKTKSRKKSSAKSSI